ncbi:Ornithine decarboxylase [Cryptotrichosporon argae]
MSITAVQVAPPTTRLRLRASAPSFLPSALSNAGTTASDLVGVLNTRADAPAHALPPAPARPARAHPVLDTEITDEDVHALVSRLVAARTAAADGVGVTDESAFFAADLSAVYQAVDMWRRSPIGDRVEIFYAVKCNTSPAVLHLLSLLGTSFDCASTAEIAQVLALPAAPSPDRIIFANPCKPASFVRAAASAGVRMMTFDNADELHKIRRAFPGGGAQLVLRILTDDSKSLCRLGLKFGAPIDSCPALLRTARQLGLDVVGVSFHVGSGCKDPAQFADAVWRARRVFDMGADAGYTFNFLDIGGGFERETFGSMSRVVRDALDVHFPADDGVRVVAEPGRLLVSSAFTLATSIIARRRAPEATSAPAPVAPPAEHTDDSASADVMYYINDGVYGSFNCIMFDHQIVHPYALTVGHAPTAPRPVFPPRPNIVFPTDLAQEFGFETETASVWGPTCDSIDCVRATVALPRGLDVGDWLAWGEMGAYTLCAASTFNGFERSPVHWTTGGDSDDARAVRAVLDAHANAQ